MKRTLVIIGGLILIGLFLIAYLIFRNNLHEKSSQATLPIEQMVKTTLQAHDFQLTRQAVSDLRETLSVNPQAVEVTQPV